MFSCTDCTATVELVAQGGAQLDIVRHGPGCPVLAAQVRRRWRDDASGLPATPKPQGFVGRAAWGPWHRRVLELEEERRREDARVEAAAERARSA